MKACSLRWWTLALLGLASTLFATRSGIADTSVYFGTYTRGGDSRGIYLAKLDAEKGTLADPVLAAEVMNPSFLEIAPSGKTIYSVSEVADFEGGGAVSAFRIRGDGTLELLNRQPSGGAGPCHVSTTSDGRIVAVANYGAGSVSSYLVKEDGSLSPPASTIQHAGNSVHPKRQQGPHAHSINFSPDDRFAYAADLGTDSIFVYAVDPGTGGLEQVSETKLPPGSGPRHFAFRPDGKFAYVINEMTLTVTAFSVNADTGALTEIQEIDTLPEGTEKQGSTAEVVVHPTGAFLYGSNRGHDTIAVYSIDGASGKLERVENEPIQGEVPRNFAITPDGRHLLAAGQKSGTVAVFSIDAKTGELEFTGSRIEVGSPVCVRFLESE